MAEETLVIQQVQDGEKLVERLRQNHFDVTAAFWVKEDESDAWSLYLASKIVDDKGLREAYRELHATFYQLPDLWIDPTDINLIGLNHPLAKDILALQKLQGVTIRSRHRLHGLGGLRMGVAHIYPATVTT